MEKPTMKERQPKGEQIRKFQDAARELGCDESEEAFDSALRKIVKRQPKGDKKADE